MLKNLKLAGTIVIVSLLMSGCVTVKKSRVNEFIVNLNEHQFTDSQKETIGEILDYVNELENY
jgi:hypothetical protein